MSVQISNPSYTAGSTAISASTLKLKRNSGTEDIDLTAFCASKTSQCSFQLMITHTDSYLFEMYQSLVDDSKLEYFTVVIKNFASSVDSSLGSESQT